MDFVFIIFLTILFLLSLYEDGYIFNKQRLDKNQENNSTLSFIAWKRFKKDKLAFPSLLFILILAFMGIFSYVFMVDKSPYASEMQLKLSTIPPGTIIKFIQIPKEDATEISLLSSLFLGEELGYKNIAISSFQKTEEGIQYQLYNSDENLFYKERDYKIMNRTYYFGADKYGRDLFSRIIYGIRISLSIGLIAVFISLIIGIFLGAIAGYFGGITDNIVMWFINVVWSLPSLLMVIAITLALGKGFWQVFIAVGLTMWVDVARVVRGQFISQREREYVEAGRALAFSDFRIIFKHILPNIIGPIIVISAANFAAAILIEAGLSFLGLGAQPPIPSWGGMIKDHYNYIIMGKAYLAIIPGIAIMSSVLAFMLLGNGLRSSLEVKH